MKDDLEIVPPLMHGRNKVVVKEVHVRIDIEVYRLLLKKMSKIEPKIHFATYLRSIISHYAKNNIGVTHE